jgi:hypothetical protein
MGEEGERRGTDLSIDEDLFQSLSPMHIDRLEQAIESGGGGGGGGDEGEAGACRGRTSGAWRR